MSHDPTPAPIPAPTASADPTLARQRPHSPRVARLLARLYRQAPPSARTHLLSVLLRPLGPLALVGIAAGAFSRLLPNTRWQQVQLTLDDSHQFDAQQVFELARYVEQKSPELLLQLPQLVTDPRLWLGSATGALLLLVLRSARQAQPPHPPQPPQPPGPGTGR